MERDPWFDRFGKLTAGKLTHLLVLLALSGVEGSGVEGSGVEGSGVEEESMVIADNPILIS